ncbi:MAG: hypothetical protein RMI56_01525 [Sulfolobales archaeon]|nr:hypothetical protein [Sulfolobales archaeon]MDW8082459.1 hypothetical protein [Sulfolobales archaeon]
MESEDFSKVAKLLKVVRATLFSLPVIVLSISVLMPAGAPQTVLKVAIGILAVIGYYEVLPHLAGYSLRVEPVIPLKLPLRNPSTVKLLESVSTFFTTWAILRLFDTLLRGNYVLFAISATATWYLAMRVLRSILTKGGLAARATAVVFTALSLVLVLVDSDFKYIEILLKLVEEVVRDTL